MTLSRRRHLAALGAWLTASSASQAQKLAGEPAGRIAPAAELVNTFEFEEMARRKLPPDLFAEAAGSDRRFFDRITFKPRLMTNVSKLDLSIELFGMKLFAPILLGPVARAGRFHREGEPALVRGAMAANAGFVLAHEATEPVEKIGSLSPGGWIQQVDGDSAIPLGCKAVCSTGADWDSMKKLKKRSTVPVIVKGIMNATDAKAAISYGADGIVVSSYRGANIPGLAAPIEVLPPIMDTVAGKMPVLIDGSFRRGSDVLKALAMGARAVLVARPAIWGLAAYGETGVRHVLELLQTELARDMAMMGAVRPSDLRPAMLRIHRW